MSHAHEHKPIIGFSCGDLNGIGLETILKVLHDSRVLDICTPVLFANNKAVNVYRKVIPDFNLNFNIIKEWNKLNPKQVNLFQCWEEDVTITPGELTDTGGKYAVISLKTATTALKEGKIEGLVTAPIHKKNIQSSDFNYTGHTPFLQKFFGVKEVLMFMVADNMRVGLLTEHLPVKDISSLITKENILQKLQLMHQSLKQDFDISKPKIAVLGLNPHAGDEGLIGKEEMDIIKPTIKEAKQRNMLCFGPYSADGFFARGHHEEFDAVLALYHDQGLIPFKSLAFGEGTNFTAGLPGVRTSPDHGTAFDIAGKGIADESSTRQALFTCIDIIRRRKSYAEQRSNPLKRNHRVGNQRDEAIRED
jgi:4-hydroxythreonine-4-phosphate dehydrogenase